MFLDNGKQAPPECGTSLTILQPAPPFLHAFAMVSAIFPVTGKQVSHVDGAGEERRKRHWRMTVPLRPNRRKRELKRAAMAILLLKFPKSTEISYII